MRADGAGRRVAVVFLVAGLTAVAATVPVVALEGPGPGSPVDCPAASA